MELNANVFGTFIKVDKGSEAMITLLQDFYEKHYEVQPEFPEFITREGQPLTPHIIPSASS